MRRATHEREISAVRAAAREYFGKHFATELESIAADQADRHARELEKVTGEFAAAAQRAEIETEEWMVKILDSRPTLAELHGQYLYARGHTLSTAGIADPVMRIVRQAHYVCGESDELSGAAYELAAALPNPSTRLATRPVDADRAARAWVAVRHEVADVILSAVTLAGFLPGSPSAESLIAEKTEHDRGRG